MSRLYLSCGLCGRKQADGLLSRGYWGHVELGGGNALRACPTCKQQHADWETRLRASTSDMGGEQTQYGIGSAGVSTV
jgi:hypothetical protein